MSSVAGTDIGDAFAALYDELDSVHLGATQLEAWTDDHRYIAAFAATEAALGPTTEIDTSVIIAARSAGLEAIYGCLAGLDVALSAANTWVPARDRRTALLQLRRERTNSYCLHATGAILSKRVRQREPQVGAETLRDAFDILRVSPQTLNRVRILTLDSDLDHRTRTPGSPLTVQAVPLAVDATDLQMVSTTTAQGRPIYTATPGPAIASRIPPAINAMHGADIALAPESTLDDAILGAWVAQATDDSPTWIFAGTGPIDDPTMPGASAPVGTGTTAAGVPLHPNRGVLLHGPTGEILAVQDKQSGFSLPAPYLPDYGLATAPDLTHDEGIEPGNRLTVVESSAGRIAVFVCEDLGREIDLGILLVELGITHLIVPILATPIRQYRWQQTAGSHIAQRAGTSTVIVNSLTLGRWDPDDTTQGAATLMTIEPAKASFTPDCTHVRNPDASKMTADQDATLPRAGTIHTR